MVKSKNTTAEEWRKISECSSYSVSNLGRVRRDVAGYHTYPGRILSTHHGTRYARIGLKGDNNKWRTYLVHRLVASAFIENPSKAKDVNHKDGIKKNNAAENLEWCSRSENMAHAIKEGLVANGERHSQAILKSSDIYEIRHLCRWGFAVFEIALMYGVHRRTISDIIHGKTWLNVA